MAQVTTVTLVDDLDGSEADTTVKLGWDGKEYELDLAEANAEKLWALLEPFIAKARKAATYNRVPVKALTKPRSGREQVAEMREWARAKGFKINDRGRVPAEVLEAWANRGTTRFQDPDPAPAGDVAEVDVSAEAAKEVGLAIEFSQAESKDLAKAKASRFLPSNGKAKAPINGKDVLAATEATATAQKAARTKKAAELKAKAEPSSPAHNGAIRDWAAANGLQCAPTGRIPRAVVEAFNKAHAPKAKA